MLTCLGIYELTWKLEATSLGCGMAMINNQTRFIGDGEDQGEDQAPSLGEGQAPALLVAQ